MKQAPDWEEHRLAVHESLPVGDPARAREASEIQSMKSHIAATTRYLMDGFFDDLIQDADDTPFAGDASGGYSAQAVAAWAIGRPRPLRFVRATHAGGDGLLLKTKNRATIAKPKTQTWFINYERGPKTPDDIREIAHNLKTGMPEEHVALLYDVSINRIRSLREWMGLESQKTKARIGVKPGESSLDN